MDFTDIQGNRMETPTDALLRDHDEFHGTESEPLPECPTGLTHEEIVAAAIADAGRGTACTITVLATDLNNSGRLFYARTKLLYDKDQMNELAEEMMIGKSKAYELWKIFDHPGYVEQIWEKVAAERVTHAKRGKHGLEYRAKGWRYYFDWCLDQDGLKRETKPRAAKKKPEPLAGTPGSTPDKAQAELAPEVSADQASVTMADPNTTILARLAAGERELEQKIAELAAARAEIDRLKAEIERLRHQTAVAAEADGIADRQVANVTGSVSINALKAFAADRVATDQETSTEVTSGMAEPLPATQATRTASRPSADAGVLGFTPSQRSSRNHSGPP
jgi:hypothetical protein